MTTYDIILYLYTILLCLLIVLWCAIG